ncbi:MAG: response regulator [Deltaproteobacteria bacterium]|nr:response regulator [Deltaproteobacteria bacterium]
MANVLIVDDDPHFRAIIERVILRNHACSVTAAATEEEAWDHLSKQTCDLVLLDLHIEGKKSWDTLKKIGEMPAGPAVIVVTCDDTRENAEYSRSLGAADFLSKPIDFGRLKESIEAALGAGCPPVPPRA